MSITCKSLDHIYGYNTPFEYYALKNVNLKIEKGSFTAIIGQTGSGKSTLIQHINALLLPTSGEIKIDDYIISQNNKPQNLKSQVLFFNFQNINCLKKQSKEILCLVQ